MLAGKTALITGGSGHMGAGIASEFLAHGAAVMITGRNARRLSDTVQELATAIPGAQVASINGDAVDQTHWHDAVRAAIDTFGSLDILVNNAATDTEIGPLMQADLNEVLPMFDLNVVAPVGFTQAAYRHWMHQHGGSVINLVSGFAFTTSKFLALTGASKAALAALTKELALELGPNIRVNAISPGLIDVGPDRIAQLGGQTVFTNLTNTYPIPHPGKPADIGKAAVFLASDNAAWITGAILPVDGGYLVNPPSRKLETTLHQHNA
ncbi:MAG: SDR family oxidoreductase [Mycobacterium sp.]